VQVDAKIVEIKIENFKFNPAQIEVESGDYIKFYNEAMESHCVKSNDFEILRLAPKASAQILVVEEGVYQFKLETYPQTVGTFVVKKKVLNNVEQQNIENENYGYLRTEESQNNNIKNKELKNNNQLLPATGSSKEFLYFLIFMMICLFFLSINKQLKTK
jgi:hypothetical protein